MILSKRSISDITDILVLDLNDEATKNSLLQDSFERFIAKITVKVKSDLGNCQTPQQNQNLYTKGILIISVWLFILKHYITTLIALTQFWFQISRII